MRRLGRTIRAILILVAVIWALLTFLPREEVVVSYDGGLGEADPVALLAEREAAFDDIVPGTEARIVWAGTEGTATDFVVLNLHGFSATSEEIRPVPDRVAEALGANLVFGRLPGHGRSGPAMAEPRAGDWVDDTALMLDIARAVGDRVLIIGTSTGGTLAAYAAQDPVLSQNVVGIVYVSPNFRLANPAGVLLELPYARRWVPWIAGAERVFETQNDAHAQYWTEAYPTVATVTLGTLMRETRARDYADVEVPALFLFSEVDQVVSAQASRRFAARWGGPVTLSPLDLPEEGVDPYNHVLAGDILSPAMTDRTVREILDWVRAELP